MAELIRFRIMLLPFDPAKIHGGVVG